MEFRLADLDKTHPQLLRGVRGRMKTLVAPPNEGLFQGGHDANATWRPGILEFETPVEEVFGGIVIIVICGRVRHRPSEEYQRVEIRVSLLGGTRLTVKFDLYFLVLQRQPFNGAELCGIVKRYGHTP